MKCSQRKLEYNRWYRWVHRDKINLRKRGNRCKTPPGKPPPEPKCYQRTYHEENKELRAKYGPDYRKICKEIIAERWRKYRRERRVRDHNAQGTCTTVQWFARVEYYGWGCAYCKCELDLKTLTCDHQIPLSKGGTNWPSNLVPACRSCNSAKYTKKPSEMAA